MASKKKNRKTIQDWLNEKHRREPCKPTNLKQEFEDYTFYSKQHRKEMESQIEASMRFHEETGKGATARKCKECGVRMPDKKNTAFGTAPVKDCYWHIKKTKDKEA